MKTVEAPLTGQAEVPTSVEAFQAFLREQARRALMAMIAQEVDELCGPRYRPDAEASHYRAGSVESSVELSGHRESVRRPRVRQRSESGSVEVLLKTWEMAREPSQWENAMMRAILCG